MARVRVELNGIGLAFEMYAMDYGTKLPPVRNNCNTDLASHWCEMPVELANEHYLPHGNQGGLEADIEDVFNPGHTTNTPQRGRNCSTERPPEIIPCGFRPTRRT